MSVVEATRREIERLAAGNEDIAEGALAASALELASQLDDPGNSATSKSMCAKVLLETLDKIRALAPPKVERDVVDELSSRRARRIGRKSAAKS